MPCVVARQHLTILVRCRLAGLSGRALGRAGAQRPAPGRQGEGGGSGEAARNLLSENPVTAIARGEGDGPGEAALHVLSAKPSAAIAEAGGVASCKLSTGLPTRHLRRSL